MSLRDWFAGMAIGGLISDPTLDDWSFKETAISAYGFADAMMEARKEAKQ